MNINIVCVGNLKEQYWQQACNEYIKRLSKFAKTNVIELPEIKLAKNGNLRDIETVINHESESIISKLKGYNILLDVLGEKKNSEEFAGILKEKQNIASTINFIIGGSFGVNQKLKRMVDYAISFSNFTLPHQLMRVVVLEQVYRAFTINNHITYHK